MKAILSLSFMLATFLAFAEDLRAFPVPWMVVSDTVNPQLKTTEGRIRFRVTNADFTNNHFVPVIKTSVNGVWKDMKVNDDGTFGYLLEPGTYSFRMYVNSNYTELSIDPQKLDAQHDVLINISFQPISSGFVESEIIVDKPVIYLSSETALDFNLNVIPNGEFTFTYPEIKKGWKGVCDGSGKVNVDGINYPYLFWESSQQYMFKPTSNGYRVSRENALVFLEKKCDELGFTDNQRTDFITYWGPRMMNFDELFVQFHINEDCDQFAGIVVSPQPDNINRVYIAITEWDDAYRSYVSEGTLPKIKNDGFTLTEWGGFQFNACVLEALKR